MSKRGRAGFLAVLAAGLAFVAGYLRCGAGWVGLGDGDGDGDEMSSPAAESPATDAAPRSYDAMAAPCELHLGANGLLLDDAATTAEAAAAVCASRGRAMFTVAGDVLHGEAERVRGVLRSAGVELYTPEAEPEATE